MTDDQKSKNVEIDTSSPKDRSGYFIRPDLYSNHSYKNKMLAFMNKKMINIYSGLVNYRGIEFTGL